MIKAFDGKLHLGYIFHPKSADLNMHYKTIHELAPHIKSGDLSPVELTQSQLNRIEKLDGTPT